MLKPLNGNVVLKKKKDKLETKGGIALITLLEKMYCKAEVVNIGEEDKNTTIKVGDTVVYKKYSGTIVDFNNEKYVLIDKREILAKE